MAGAFSPHVRIFGMAASALAIYEQNKNKLVAPRESSCQPGKNRHSTDSGVRRMSKTDLSEFRHIRERAGLSLEEAARLIEVSDRTAYRYEAGTSAPTKLALRTLNNAARKRAVAQRKGHAFTFIDLFAGIGGLRIGFEKIGGRCVFTSEWDEFCRKTYSANFSVDHQFGGDIREFARDPSRIPQHDVLVAGFPCQPFSIAGVSKKNALGRPHGFLCDTQGTLFFDLAQIIAHHRPAVFVLENVKNLERHDSGRTFATILNVLSQELGYRVHHQVISSEAWVPQRRERIFIVGFREDSQFDFSYLDIPRGRKPRLGDILESPEQVDPKYTLTPHLWNYLQAYKAKHAKKGNGFGYSVFGPGDVTRTLSARYFKDGSEILVAQPGKRPRRLTPRECSRLMGFDRPQGNEFKIHVSDTQAYRQFGNAVVVPVVKAVAELLLPHIQAALKPTVAPATIKATAGRRQRVAV
jgi:DNA (cytosine-5)-methyltransferase 1